MSSRPTRIHANKSVSYKEIANIPPGRTAQKEKNCAAKEEDYSMVELVPRQSAPAGLMITASLTSVYLVRKKK
jgi:hypothetical protein